MSSQGPAYWGGEGDHSAFSEGFYFNGLVLHGGAGLMKDLSMEVAADGISMPTLGGTDVEQLIWIGGDVPISMRARSLRVPIRIAEEADYFVLQDSIDQGSAVGVWFDWPMTDSWYIPGNDLGTSWKFSRQLPYNLVPGVDQSTRPPEAWFEEPDGTKTALTVVTAAPATGEVQIPDSDGYLAATTFAGDADASTYKFLRIRYHPMLLVKTQALSFVYSTHNSLVFNMDMKEHRGGLYTPAAGV